MEATLPITTMLGFLLALVRTTAWMAVSPPFNNRMIPRTVKLGIAASISLVLAPQLPADKMTTDASVLVPMILMQILTGLMLGYITNLLFSAVQAAGSMIDIFGGFSMSQAMDPFGNNQSSIFGRFYQLFATVLLFVINGHLLLIKGFMTSFDVVPLGGPDLENFKELLLQSIAKFGLASIEIAGPLLAAYFLADVAMGLLTKAAPQLNILTFSPTLKILLTLLIVGSAIPLISGALHSLLTDILKNGIAALHAGGG